MKGKDKRAGGVLAGWNHLPVVGAMQIKDAQGARVLSESGEWYDDYIMGWGSCFLGHDSPILRESIEHAIKRGFLQQYETEAHRQLAEKFCELVPCAEKLRLVNSGLEATMYAVRLARVVTGRKIILKFEGHFHGLNDALAWNIDCSSRCGQQYPDGTLERVPGVSGVPAEFGESVVPLPWNDLGALEGALQMHRGDVAGIIMEPVALNIGCIKPDSGFLAAVRALADKNGVALIFDEVLTGFRSNIGGAQAEYEVAPDIATFGKAFGCGMPIAGIAGRAEYMDAISPSGVMQICGTNSGRYLSVVATLAALEYLQDGAVYEYVRRLEDRMISGMVEVFGRHSIPCYIDGYGGRIGVHIGSPTRPRTMREVQSSYSVEFANRLFRCLSEDFHMYGFLMPLAFCPEPITLSAAHTLKMVDMASERLDAALKKVNYHE